MTHARIAKQFPPRFSLDVEFGIAPGVTALYGPAGAGKTLILEIIAGFVRPDSGRILLDDVILFDAESRVSVPPHRRNCGYIAQRDALFPHMTLRQNLLFPAKRFPRLERHRRVAEMTERFQLSDSATLRPGEASPAQKLGCATARALIAEPKLLLIDERGLDEPLLQQIRAAFAGPILLATHDLDLICAVADVLIVIDGGRIVQCGAPRAVLDQPTSVEIARLLGIPNLFRGTIAALDPARDSSRLDFGQFALTGPYIPGHFRGDSVWVAVHPEDLRAHSGGLESPPNFVSAQLVRVSHRTRWLRLEFSGGIFADISREEFARQKDNKDWQVEFPPSALRVL
ncbi:MAG: ABC transporter ATP-binding protein [Bryobacteraceae bacterium]|jgi:ABC-type sulfate/molybdate transport systems ATPase subunit